MKPAPPEAMVFSQETPSEMNEQGPSASKSAEEVPKSHASAELIARLQEGDQQAFREVFELYNRRAYAVAFGVVKNQQDALDIVQDAFIKVHKHIASFQGTSSFYTWLYRIVMNQAIDHVRKVRRVTDFDDRVALQESAASEPLMPHIQDANPGKNVVREELKAKIREALKQLPEYHQAVILLREVEGMSYEEISAVLGIPKGTVMSRLFHARKKMQESLQNYLEGDFEIEG